MLKFVKKDLLTIIILALVFITLFTGLYIYDLKTNGLAEYAASFYSFLIK